MENDFTGPITSAELAKVRAYMEEPDDFREQQDANRRDRQRQRNDQRRTSREQAELAEQLRAADEAAKKKVAIAASIREAKAKEALDNAKTKKERVDERSKQFRRNGIRRMGPNRNGTLRPLTPDYYNETRDRDRSKGVS